MTVELKPMLGTEIAHFIIDLNADFDMPKEHNGVPTGIGALTSWPRTEGIGPRIAEMITSDVAHGAFLVFTLDTHPPRTNTPAYYDYQAMLAHVVGVEKLPDFLLDAQNKYVDEVIKYGRHCEYGSPGWMPSPYCEALLTATEDSGRGVVIQKPCYDFTTGYVMQLLGDIEDKPAGMSGTELVEYLWEQGIRRVYLHGLITPVCVAAAGKVLAARGFEVIVDLTRNTVQSFDEESHQAGVAELKATPGVIVIE
jgi:nicotinamidase-related amidase